MLQTKKERRRRRNLHRGDGVNEGRRRGERGEGEKISPGWIMTTPQKEMWKVDDDKRRKRCRDGWMVVVYQLDYTPALQSKLTQYHLVMNFSSHYFCLINFFLPPSFLTYILTHILSSLPHIMQNVRSLLTRPGIDDDGQGLGSRFSSLISVTSLLPSFPARNFHIDKLPTLILTKKNIQGTVTSHLSLFHFRGRERKKMKGKEYNHFKWTFGSDRYNFQVNRSLSLPQSF